MLGVLASRRRLVKNRLLDSSAIIYYVLFCYLVLRLYCINRVGFLDDLRISWGNGISGSSLVIVGRQHEAAKHVQVILVLPSPFVSLHVLHQSWR